MEYLLIFFMAFISVILLLILLLTGITLAFTVKTSVHLISLIELINPDDEEYEAEPEPEPVLRVMEEDKTEQNDEE